MATAQSNQPPKKERDPNLITMYAPRGASSLTLGDGTEYEVSKDGTVEIPSQFANDALSHGYAADKATK